MKLREATEAGILSMFRRRFVFILILVLLVGSAVYWFHFRATKNGSLQSPDSAPSRSATIQPAIQSAEDSLKTKDYINAAGSYLAAADDATASNQPKMAESILKDAIAKIPAQNVSWYIYSSLAQTEKQLGNTSSEKQNLQLAIQKASVAGTDISPDQLKGLQSRLDAIK